MCRPGPGTATRAELGPLRRLVLAAFTVACGAEPSSDDLGAFDERLDISILQVSCREGAWRGDIFSDVAGEDLERIRLSTLDLPAGERTSRGDAPEGGSGWTLDRQDPPLACPVAGQLLVVLPTGDGIYGRARAKAAEPGVLRGGTIHGGSTPVIEISTLPDVEIANVTVYVYDYVQDALVDTIELTQSGNGRWDSVWNGRQTTDHLIAGLARGADGTIIGLYAL